MYLYDFYSQRSIFSTSELSSLWGHILWPHKISILLISFLLNLRSIFSTSRLFLFSFNEVQNLRHALFTIFIDLEVKKCDLKFSNLLRGRFFRPRKIKWIFRSKISNNTSIKMISYSSGRFFRPLIYFFARSHFVTSLICYNSFLF